LTPTRTPTRPGFQANHTNPNDITQGITTVVVNQDGRSPQWPLSRQKALYEQQGIGTNAILMVGPRHDSSAGDEE
jgi:hypothetical protein